MRSRGKRYGYIPPNLVEEVISVKREENIRDGSYLFAVISIPIFITIFLLLVAWFLPPDKYPALKIGLMLASFIFVFQAYQYATIALGADNPTTSLIDAMGENTLVYTWVYWILFTGVILTLIYDIFMMFRKPKTGEGYDEK